jgi:hypothetical protein
MGYGRFDGVETARLMARLYAAARLYVNFFQPSFKLKEKHREGAKVIKRYHVPSTPCKRALVHPKLAAAVKKRLREQYRTLDPVALLAEIRAAQEELGNRVDRRAIHAASNVPTMAPHYSRYNYQHPTQSLLRRRSARRLRSAIRLPRTDDPSGPIRRGFACRPSSTRTLLRSRTGLLRSRN